MDEGSQQQTFLEHLLGVSRRQASQGQMLQRWYTRGPPSPAGPVGTFRHVQLRTGTAPWAREGAPTRVGMEGVGCDTI